MLVHYKATFITVATFDIQGTASTRALRYELLLLMEVININNFTTFLEMVFCTIKQPCPDNSIRADCETNKSIQLFADRDIISIH